MPEGKGIPNIFPPLAKSKWLQSKITESIHAVKYGLRGEISVNGIHYNSSMASLGLTNVEIADVMNYILNSWGNSYNGIITENKVKNVQK